MLTRRAVRNRATAVLRSEQRLEDRYLLSGFLIVACILAFAFAGDGPLGRVLSVVLEGITLIVILRASQVRPRTMRIVGFCVAVALVAVAGTVVSAGDSTVARAAPVMLGAGLALGGPIAIVRRLRDQAEIDFMTVAGALCIYLLAGLFFALLYWSIGVFEHAPFFVQTTSESGVDFTYYSFVTLTTVGYGDLTASQDPGRMCSILEALFGQLYLVSVVALLVANIGRTRRHRGSARAGEVADGQELGTTRPLS